MAVQLKQISHQELGLALIEALASGLTIRPTGTVENSYWVDDTFLAGSPFLTAIYFSNGAGWVADCACGQSDLCLHVALAYAERKRSLEQLAPVTSLTIASDRLPIDFQEKFKARALKSGQAQTTKNIWEGK